MDKIRETAIEWYKRLAFPEKYDGQFEALLSETYPIANRSLRKMQEQTF